MALDPKKFVSGTKIMKCDCNHPAQDEFHGKNNRVHNRGKAADSCTVCGKKKAN